MEGAPTRLWASLAGCSVASRACPVPCPRSGAGSAGGAATSSAPCSSPYILAIQLLSLASLAAAGGVDAGDLRRFALTVPAILAGVLLGMRLYARIDERRFRQVILVLLLASGTALVLS